MNLKEKFSRRDFMKLTALGLGAAALGQTPLKRVFAKGQFSSQNQLSDIAFPEGKLLGRICAGSPGARFDIKSEPNMNAPSVGTAWFDDVFEWKQEVIASSLDPIRINQRWVEVPEGYIYAENVQKTRYIPQIPLAELPTTNQGTVGMWVEIVTPIIDLELTKPQSSYQFWVRETIIPRIYYSQIFWAFDIRQHPETAKTQYCLKQLYGAFDESYWVNAEVCRQITEEEISPIHPDAVDKRVVVDLRYQTLSCFEGTDEVFFTKVTTGGIDQEGKWLTPVGTHTIWRKTVSIHMSAGAAVGNYDIPGIGWSTFFDNEGAAIHATFWHNYFGTARSHGCVNVKPDDAKWIWRWTEPAVPYSPGDWMATDGKKPTLVEVVED